MHIKITGGVFNHTSHTHFEGSDKTVIVEQHFHGLNVWDQLSVDITIVGDLPDDVFGHTITVPDVIEEYTYGSPNSLQSLGTSRIMVDDQEIVYRIDQKVY